MSKLTLLPGWHGGEWQIDGVTQCLPGKFKVCIRDKVLETKVVEINGHDSDHGHRYSWYNVDIILKVPSIIGTIELSLREYLAKHKRTKFVTIISQGN